MFKNRSTGETLIILVAITVCSYVVVSMVFTIALAFFTDRDISDATQSITDVINTLIGLLAGFLAGRTDAAIIKRDLEKSMNDTPKEPK